MDTSQDLEPQVWKTLLLTKTINLNNLDVEKSWQNFYDFTELCEEYLSEVDDYSKLHFDIVYWSEGTLFFINNKWWPEAIHNFCSKHNFPIENITFKTSCFVLKESYKKWKNIYRPNDKSFNIKTRSFGLNLYKTKIKTENFKQRKYKFNCLNGRMVGARQVFMLGLWQNKLLTKDVLQDNIVSFHYHKNDFEWDIEGIDIPEELNNICPIEFDIKNNSNNYFDGAERKLYENSFCQFGDYSNIYNNSYVSIVTDACETTLISNLLPKEDNFGRNEYLNEFYDEMFISEKTSRPILNLHPFIIFGTNNILSTLRDLGFETFGDFWDENYDTDLHNKLDIICKNMHQINEMSLDELDTMYNKMLPILNHNRNLLISKKF